MPIPTFTPRYPPDGSSLGQTKSTIRNNLDGTFETLAVDHIDNNGNPGTKPAGYHNVVHMVPQGSNPGAVVGYGQLFSKTVNSFTTDEALFWETGAGLIQQLTVNLTPSPGANGYTFIPGGIILQWGTVSPIVGGGTPTDVNFNITFPNNCYNIQMTLDINGTSGTGNAQTIAIVSFNTANFKYNYSGGSAYDRFYWFAIGN